MKKWLGERYREWLYNLRSAPSAVGRTTTRAESERVKREAERRFQEEEQWRVDHLDGGCPCEAKQRRRR